MHLSKNPLQKKAEESTGKYPIATVAYYGPNDKRATKVVVGIIEKPEGDVADMRKWASGELDVRHHPRIHEDILAFIRKHNAQSVIITDRIIGCPHEEGDDYPIGGPCPMCSFWKNRDRWTGELFDPEMEEEVEDTDALDDED